MTSGNAQANPRVARVLMISRRFWPHGCYESAASWMRLSTGLSRLGLHIEIATPRYASSWPEQITYRELRVHRPVVAARSDWTVSRYTRHLTQWIRSVSRSFDVIMLNGIREEAIAAMDATRGNTCRTLLCYDGSVLNSDAKWWGTSRAAKRCVGYGRLADGVTVQNASEERDLLIHQFAPEKIHRIPVGFPADPQHSKTARESARRALAKVNSDLHLEEDSIVLLCQAPMKRGGSIHQLVRSTQQIVTRHPNVKIWLIGDGTQRDQIYARLRGDGARSYIAMPGTFCDYDDLMMAADIYIQTGEEGLTTFLPSAVAATLPIVAKDCSAVRNLLAADTSKPRDRGSKSAEVHGASIRWYDDQKPSDLCKQISGMIRELSKARVDAQTFRRNRLEFRSENEWLDQYANLIQILAAKGNTALKPIDRKTKLKNPMENADDRPRGATG